MADDHVNCIKSLKPDKVHVKNPQKVNDIITGIIEGGFNQLQIVSDFDLTITKQHENGKRHMSSFRMFEHCPSVTDKYKETTTGLMMKYYPLEYDPNIPLDEKSKIMEEWWKQSEIALNGLKVSPEELDTVVATLTTSLRDGSKDLFLRLHDHNVPVLVFSAGLGNSVEAILKLYGVNLPNVKIISNFLKYDETGTIVGFQGPLIHVLNKNEFAIKHSPYFDLIKDRGNVLLMGDSLGDARMADGMDHANHVLKIGFIYEKVEGNLPAYLDTFDIVLEDDQTMDVASAIVKLIEQKHAQC